MDTTRMGGAEGMWDPGSKFKLLVHSVRRHQRMCIIWSRDTHANAGHHAHRC